MPTTLTIVADERSTYGVDVSFTDEVGAALTPNAGLTWSLFQKIDGVDTVVNNRLSVPIASASTVTVVLSLLDLALIDGTSKMRYLLLEGTFNSSLGTNLPLKKQVAFQIENLVGVPNAALGVPPEPDMATQAELDAHAALTTSAHGGIAASGHTHTTGLPAQIGVAVSDETTAITTGTAKVTFRMPFAMTLTSVRANLKTASSSGNPAIDVNEGGVSIFSTTLTIDSGEKTSVTAATPAVISDSALADDAEITVDIDTAGTGAVGLKLWLIGTRA